MRILHLGFEDPRKPGAGGCAKRSHSINRRLADRHDITVLTCTYTGAQPGELDGVQYIPVGVGTGRLAAVSYWAAVVPQVQRRAADLVVEEFNPPFGPGFAPLYTRTPVVASVGWLFADAMQNKYHLPFVAVQQRGLHLYHDFITVTQGMADQLEAQLPGARCRYVPNGLDDSDFIGSSEPGADIVLLGRLDMGQKGLDLALDVVAGMSDTPGRLLIAGDGRDRGAIARQIAARGLHSRVTLLGAVHGQEKLELLRRARVLLMPSRYETFGIVALEAFAAGCPVVGFEIPGLREVAVGPAACLVPVGDTAALRQALSDWWCNPEAAKLAGSHGPVIARRYRWDEIAVAQEAAYLEVLQQSHRKAA
jgi:glycosyltransferase involved in cell wall biosynthesis